MSRAGIEPATYGYLFVGDSNSSTDALPTELSRPLTDPSPRHLLDCFICTGRMSPKLHVEVLHSLHVRGACTQLVCIYMHYNVGLSLVIKTSNLIGLMFLYSKIYF